MTSTPDLEDLFCVIMAGGAGTRFWPASTEDKPKQLLTLVGDRSLLQLAVDRARAVVPAERVIVVTSQRLSLAVRAQLPELPDGNVIAEPERRDTAAAVVLASLVVASRGGERVAILTADHLIGPTEVFVDAVVRASTAAVAVESSIVTFGVVPSYPATGYGYLRVDTIAGDDARPVRSFVEKPDLDTATEYLVSGQYLWNSGMFVFRTATMAAVAERHLPVHVEALTVAGRHAFSPSALAIAFRKLPKISIDKGLMEKHDAVVCIPARFAWSDVGSFPALADHLPVDHDGNAHRGQVQSLDARNNVVWCEDASEQVSLVGVENLVVVRAGRQTLVAPKDRAEEVKKIAPTS